MKLNSFQKTARRCLGKIGLGLMLLYSVSSAWAVPLSAQETAAAQEAPIEAPSPEVQPPGAPGAPYAYGADGQYPQTDPSMQFPPPEASTVDTVSTDTSSAHRYKGKGKMIITDATGEEVSDEADKKTSAKTAKKKAGGDTISLDLRGIDITEFFKVLSRKLKINIIPSKKVSGRVNLFLNDISYKDALDVVILSQGLAYEKRGDDIILIMTEAEYEALYGKKFNDKKVMKSVKLQYAQPKLVFNALSSIKSTVGNVLVDEATGTILLIDTPEKLQEMMQIIGELDLKITTEIFELQYAKATDLKDHISTLASEGTSSVLADDRSNTIIVTDLPGNMHRIKQALTMLDQETKEVFIEAEIIEITLRDRLQSGINWDVIMSQNFYDWALNGTFAAGLAAGLVGTFTSEKPIDVTLQFLNTIADTRVLSRPRIAVTNGEEAVIMVGTREAYVTGTTSQSGESTITSDTVEFVDVGVKLTVVPTINRDRFITMKVKPEVSTVLRTLTTGDPDAPRSQIPIVSTSEAETTVKIKDGTTIMIAGLRQNQDTEDVNGLPYLSRIPFLDILFSRRDRDKDQTEIVVFITAYIIRGEQMRIWDIKQMKKFPEHARPEGKGYTDSTIKKRRLKEFKNGR